MDFYPSFKGQACKYVSGVDPTYSGYDVILGLDEAAYGALSAEFVDPGRSESAKRPPAHVERTSGTPVASLTALRLIRQTPRQIDVVCVGISRSKGLRQLTIAGCVGVAIKKAGVRPGEPRQSGNRIAREV